MSNPEAPRFDFAPSTHDGELTDEQRAELDTKLNNRVTDLLEKIDSRRNPDSIRHDFTFHGDMRALYVPRNLHAAIARYGQIDEIAISTSQFTTDKTQPGDIAIRFELYSDVSEETSYVVIDHQHGSSLHPGDVNYVYGEAGTLSAPVDSVPAVSKRDINRIVGSLINNNAGLHKSAYDKQPWLNTNYYSLTDHLVDASNYYSASADYVLHSEDGGVAGYAGFDNADGDMVERFVYRIDSHNIDISDDGNLGYFEKGLEISIDKSSGQSIINFVEHRTLDDDYSTELLNPKAADYAQIFQFIDEQQDRESAHTTT